MCPIAERPGNKRADGYLNVLSNPHVGLIALIPGRNDTLRVNGRARLVREVAAGPALTVPYSDDFRERLRAVLGGVGPIAEVEAGYLKHISMRVQIEPSELADMVLFLSSDAARKITGELIAVSGNLEWEE